MKKPSSALLRQPLLGALLVAALLVGSLPACAREGNPELPPGVAEATSENGLYAVMVTSMGPIVCRLYPEKTPVTVGNFVGLAEGTREWKDPRTGEMQKRPFYDGLKFHRVIKNFMIQGGDPLGTGQGGPGYQFIDEFSDDLHHDGPGVLSMANAGPGTNGSQFFITHKATPWLDGRHTIFGRVVMGQDVVDAMADVPMTGPQNSTPVDDIILERVIIVRRGAKAKAFDAAAAFARQDEILAQRKKEEERRALAFRKELDDDLAHAVTTDSGLKYVVRKQGTGPKPTRGQKVATHYTGYLESGKKFDSSRDRGRPFQLRVGVDPVIKGWTEALMDMRAGEERRLIIPPELGYGERGYAGVIPPNATLIFDVELISIETP